MTGAMLNGGNRAAKLLDLPKLTSKQYGLYVALASLPVLAACMSLTLGHPFPATAFYALLAVAIMVSFFPVPISTIGVYLSSVLPVTMCVLYRCGPLAAVAVEIAAITVQVFWINRGIVRSRPKSVAWGLLHNTTQQVVAVGIAGSLFQLALDSHLFIRHSLDCAVALSLTALAAHFLNAFFVTTVASKAFGMRWDVVWFENYRWTVRGAILMAPLGFIAGVVSEQQLAYGVGMIAFPLLAAQRGYELHVKKLAMYRQGVDLLGRLMQEAHPYTHGHLHRVATWAKRIAERIGLNPRSMMLMEDAAILHDIGKVAIDDRILNKVGALTEREWNNIKQHPEIGSEIVAKMRYLDKVSNWIRHHHERFDGMGYPLALAGDAIPIEARIIAVVDAFDAMVGGPSKTEQRTYRKPMSYRAACEELNRCSGTQFDGEVVRAFIAILEEDGTITQKSLCKDYRLRV